MPLRMRVPAAGGNVGDIRRKLSRNAAEAADEPSGVGGHLDRQINDPCGVHRLRFIRDRLQRRTASAEDEGIAGIDDSDRGPVTLAQAVDIASGKPSNEHQPVAGLRGGIHGFGAAGDEIERDRPR